ncbi:TerD family protein [Chitinophaga pendula]|uniref:TerD family protein n=1 Tax=Chitinophaga TaxID=79328 RepID=UPI000BB09E31|nr:MULTISPECIES: TerD family protein [Chitinophaga]ASZ10741.1 hypothetical protein CK934_06985 [Chitinophaga sp. MD30]UCJ06283.1 TerD family protein [Chitinophaga pendula]
MNQLLKAGLRQRAIYIPQGVRVGGAKEITPTTSLLVANLSKLGYAVTEELLHILNGTTPGYQATILEVFREVMGVDKNWTPLVKGWDVATEEGWADHVITFFANAFKTGGTKLPCGHVIPANTFALERYNGCPYCGTPFVFAQLKCSGKQHSVERLLSFWDEEAETGFLRDLLISKTALDATQLDSLRLLLSVLPLPVVKIGMKETLMVVIDKYVEMGQADKVQFCFVTPTDVLRYLWYKHTGFYQLIAPKTIVERKVRNNRYLRVPGEQGASDRLQAKAALKLKYNRAQCMMVAQWLNGLEMEVPQMCEVMHSRRGMWIRFIRALRLPEYSKRAGMDKLRALLDHFYNGNYEVWGGRVEHFRLRMDVESAMYLLKQRPGLFARSLFANMLWFGAERVVAAFSEIADKVPARLLLTLGMYADQYFDKKNDRVVKPLGGTNKRIPANRLLSLYEEKELVAMRKAVDGLYKERMAQRFAKERQEGKRMYIEPMLYNIPLAIGDRSEQVQDMPAALMGTRFALQGDRVRLFMQWGTGLPAQHMDMDLSCMILYEDKLEYCSFSRLSPAGCRHSGDIRSIPHKVGTAEYIEIMVDKLEELDAVYVVFACNAFSGGALTPNLSVGWMDSRYPMEISAKSGVAYDPACVQHQVRITQGLTKGLVFGVLDIKSHEIIWLEMAFAGQIANDMDHAGVKVLLQKLRNKTSIGELLEIKAKAQGMELVTEAAAGEEIYTMSWAQNTAAVTQLLVD